MNGVQRVRWRLGTAWRTSTVMVMDDEQVEALVRDYAALWSLQSLPLVKEKLQRVWAADACYRDPFSEVHGPAALAEHIVEFQKQFPGVTFEILELLQHHQRACFSWRMLSVTKEPLIDGRTFAEINAAGLLQACTAFFHLPG
jgi:SnoaL-like domain